MCSQSQPHLFASYRESALRGIRNHTYPQTNHFAVDDQLRGLVERFSVVGRDALADAMRERLRALSTQSTRWTPEILHLLLHLSDQPVTKSSLASLQRLRLPDAHPAAPTLTWANISVEDGWAHDSGLWHNIDFADSSDDGLEPLPDLQPQATCSGTSTSSPIASGERTAQYLTLPVSPQDSLPNEVRIAQQWRHDLQPRDISGRPTKIPVSEHQIVREVLFLLNGLPTDMFAPNCTPVPRYQLANVSWETCRALINSFAEYGRALLPLRKFCETKQDVPLVQAFQGSVRQSLQSFDDHIALFQGRYVDIRVDTVVSLVAVQEEVKDQLAPLLPLSGIVRQLQEERYAHSFRFLELLYDAACIAQSSGDERTYCLLGNIFFGCFRVYTRPIRQWMEGGDLTPGDKTFFVAESSTSVPLNQTWSDKFNLRQSQQGQLHAPRFLQPAVHKIFNTGKSIVVLKHLGRFRQPAEHDKCRLPEPPLDFASVCGSQDLAFAPFSELFDSAFDYWVQSKHLSTSSNLQAALFESCGLWSNLDALEHIYFMSDGSLADVFTSSVFTSLDAGSTEWKDRFTLTELAQEAWSPCRSLETYRLSASVELKHVFLDQPDPAQGSIRSSSLCGICLWYKLAWPVQLVITREAIANYQAVFTLLLQLRRAATILATFKSHNPHPGRQAAYYALRARLLWFTTSLHSYLTTLVLKPEIAKMRAGLREAEDLDNMIEIHVAFTQRVIEEACLGAKLAPIRECVLDVLDLAIRLEGACRAEHDRVAGEAARYARLGTPQQRTAGTKAVPPQSMLRGVYISPQERERKEDQTIVLFSDDDAYSGSQDRNRADVLNQQQIQTYAETLAAIRADFDRHLRFIARGLRSVARASSDPAAAKWDLLAEMLEMGSGEGK